MFGYVTPDMAGLTNEQRADYHRIYCGVCHAIRRRSGSSATLSLSHDMTFLALLLSSLYEPVSSDHRSRCSVHPLQRHEYLSSPMIDYAADMNILLFYLRCADQKRDHDSLLGAGAEKIFRQKASRIRDCYPIQSAAIESALNCLWDLEKSAAPDPDSLCNLSGKMLGASFVPDPDDIWAPQLQAVGEGLGRFIYWMDAWEDYDSDKKKGAFNPLVFCHDRSDYEEFCLHTLEMLIAEATMPFELLPLEKYLDILRNILYSGVWQRYALRFKKRYGKEAAVIHE